MVRSIGPDEYLGSSDTEIDDCNGHIMQIVQPQFHQASAVLFSCKGEEDWGKE